MKTDIEIARAATLKPMAEVGAKLGIPKDALIPYGRDKAKIDRDFIATLGDRPDGRLVLVTAISPTPAIPAPLRRTSRAPDLIARRGVSSLNPRSSSSVLTVESIHPKQMASSLISGDGHRGAAVGVRHEHSQTPFSAAWFSSSQARTWSRVSAW